MADFDIFNIDVNDLDTGDKNGTNKSDLYKPRPDQGIDGTYKSLIRFLPNVKNPRKPFVRKYVYWLEDSSGSGFFMDSPTTIGEKCPVQDMFFKLRNSESAQDKNMSEGLKRKEHYYALVQIMKDPQNPDLEGQIKIYKFGYKVKTMIDDALKPAFGDPIQIFDPFQGKNFELIITKKGGYPNYDSSKFQGEQTPMLIDGSPVNESAESKKAIIDYLTAAPELSNFEYQSWSDDDRNKVMNVLAQYSSPGAAIGNLTESKANESKTESRAVESKTESKPVESPSVNSNDNLDDFINGLDL